MGLWLAVYFPRLALESSLSEPDSALPGLLVSSGKRVVVQCNDAARSCGVKPGMNLNTAYCLVPDVITAVYDPEKEKQALTQLALLCYRLSAQITLNHPDSLVLEVGSMLALFGGLTGYHQQLTALLEPLGYGFQCATGHTPQTAQVLSRSSQPLLSVDPNAHETRLQSLDIDQLGFSEKQVQRFKSMGLRRFRDLKKLPAKDLGYRFGSAFLAHWQGFERVTQGGERFQIPARFQQGLAFQSEVTQSKALLFPLKRIMQGLEQYLYLRQLEADHLVLMLGHRKGPDTRLVVRAVQGAWRAREWLELMAIRLEALALPAPVLSCRVVVRQFQQHHRAVGDLLGDQPVCFKDRQLLSLLVTRLGHQRVCMPSASADPRPVKSGQLVSALSPPLAETEALSRPHPVLLTRSGYPVSGAAYTLLYGPERVGSGWWDMEWTRSDYYGAVSQAGLFHWLERHPDSQWWQRGLYG